MRFRCQGYRYRNLISAIYLIDLQTTSVDRCVKIDMRANQRTFNSFNFG
jgi:hypothetical protein